MLTEIDGQKVTTAEELQRAIDSKHPGDTVSITYWRNGESHTADVKLASRPRTLPDSPVAGNEERAVHEAALSGFLAPF